MPMQMRRYTRESRYLCCILLLTMLGMALCLAVAYAQDDIWQLGKEYQNSYTFGADLLNTLIWSMAYLLIYACALVLTLSYMQLFLGFDAGMYAWIIILWLGGLTANYIGYSLVPQWHFVAALIALPLIFGWSMLVGTRAFADLAPRHALTVSLVVALVCAPYFGPTWQTKKLVPLDPNIAPPPGEGHLEQTPVRLAGLLIVHQEKYHLPFQGVPTLHIEGAPRHAACPNSFDRRPGLFRCFRGALAGATIGAVAAVGEGGAGVVDAHRTAHRVRAA